MSRKLIRSLVELAVCQPRFAVYHGNRIGRPLGLPLDQLVNADTGRNPGRGRIPFLEHLLSFSVIEYSDFGNGSIP